MSHETRRADEIPELSQAALTSNEELGELFAKAKAMPKDHAAWSAVGGALLDVLSSTPGSSEIQLDALDVFSYLLTLDPNDAAALRSLGDLCFDQRLFQKSLSYYDRYLAIHPEDNQLRARRASTLTFLGRSGEAVTELEDIANKEPEAFQPLAFLAIALSQNGDIEKARAVGEQALAKAPSAEARERFSAFLSSLPTTGSAATATQGQAQESPSVPTQSWLSLLEDQVRRSPIAGPKMRGAKVEEQTKTLVLSFADFPMEAMPEFARTKFIAGIKSAIPTGTITTINFVDAATGRVMHAETILY